MTLRLVTAPTTEPVTVAQVKQDARITTTTLDTTISTLITAARKKAEDLTGRAFITQTWELVLDEFPDEEIKIGKLPIGSITWVKYYDTSGTLTTLASDQYVLDADTLPGWLLPAYAVDWPSTYDMANSVIIRFEAGYGTADNVPEEIKLWIRTKAASEIDPDKGQVKVTEFMDSMLDSYKLFFA